MSRPHIGATGRPRSEPSITRLQSAKIPHPESPSESPSTTTNQRGGGVVRSVPTSLYSTASSPALRSPAPSAYSPGLGAMPGTSSRANKANKVRQRPSTAGATRRGAVGQPTPTRRQQPISSRSGAPRQRPQSAPRQRRGLSASASAPASAYTPASASPPTSASSVTFSADAYYAATFAELGTSKTVEKLRATARDNMRNYIREETFDDLRSSLAEENGALRRSCDARVEAAEKAQDRIGMEVQRGEEEASALREELEALRYNVHLLRKRLQLMTEREMDNQIRLKVYGQFAPIFDTLHKQFHFKSPQEVVQRLQTLETMQASYGSKLSELEDLRKQSERSLKQCEDRAQVELQRLKLELLQNNEKWEKKQNVVLDEAELFKGDLSRAAEYRSRYLDLNQAVWGLWDTVTKDTDGLIDVLNPDDFPNTDNPEEMMRALGLLVIRSKPSAAGKSLRALTVQANIMWRRFFGEGEARGKRCGRVWGVGGVEAAWEGSGARGGSVRGSDDCSLIVTYVWYGCIVVYEFAEV